MIPDPTPDPYSDPDQKSPKRNNHFFYYFFLAGGGGGGKQNQWGSLSLVGQPQIHCLSQHGYKNIIYRHNTMYAYTLNSGRSTAAGGNELEPKTKMERKREREHASASELHAPSFSAQATYSCYCSVAVASQHGKPLESLLSATPHSLGAAGL